MFSKKTIIIMSIIIGVLLLFIAGLFVWKNISAPKAEVKKPENIVNVPQEASKASIEAGKNETNKMINEVLNDVKNDPNSISKVVGSGSSTAVVVAPGTSAISVETGEVLTKSGAAAQNSEGQGRLNSVTDSLPVDSTKLPESTIKLTVSSRSISPKEFVVHPGQAVSLALTNAAPWSEVIIFADPSLSAVVFTFTPNTTKSITFNAPLKIGEFLFYSDVPAERAAGVEGKMIVQ